MTDAGAAITLFAADPHAFNGIIVRSAAGPARNAWLDSLRAALPAGMPVGRLPIGIDEARLLGGLDLAATLAAGRPVMQTGLLAAHDGGVLIVPMAERIAPALAGQLAAMLDSGQVQPREGDGEQAARVALILLDEGEGPEESVPAILAERIGLTVMLDPRWSDDDAARCPAAGEPAALDAQQLTALCALSASLGIASMRAPVFAARAAATAAMRAGRSAADDDDLALAVRLTLAAKARRLPEFEAEDQSADQPPPPPPDPTGDNEGDEEGEGDRERALDDLLVDAVQTSLPADLLAALASGAMMRGARASGHGAGARRRSPTHGKPLSSRPGMPGGGKRLALVDTLRAAAPWQALRGAPGKVHVRRSDLKIRRYADREAALVVFAVDASGSAALERLAEAKGAVELLLAEAYVKRTEVAVLAFRGASAELVLPPTRSLVRAKRALGDLAGGGPTPLAGAIEAALMLCEAARRKGTTPFLVLLTDGRGNVARDGTPDRARASEDLAGMARRFAAARFGSVTIDVAARPGEAASSLARALGGRYATLPRLDARGVQQVVAAAMPG